MASPFPSQERVGPWRGMPSCARYEIDRPCAAPLLGRCAITVHPDEPARVNVHASMNCIPYSATKSAACPERIGRDAVPRMVGVLVVIIRGHDGVPVRGAQCHRIWAAPQRIRDLAHLPRPRYRDTAASPLPSHSIRTWQSWPRTTHIMPRMNLNASNRAESIFNERLHAAITAESDLYTGRLTTVEIVAALARKARIGCSLISRPRLLPPLKVVGRTIPKRG